MRCLFLCALSVVPCAAVEPDVYSVGVARVDITPDYPVRLNGFGNRRAESEGIGQRIHAKALAISQGKQPPIVVFTIDNLGVRTRLVDAVAADLREAFGIPRQNVVVTFTHTHCAPKVDGASDNIFSTPIPAPHQRHIARYTRELTEALKRVGRQAVRNRRNCTLAFGVGTVRFAKNRRTAGGPVDHDLPLLVVRDVESDDIVAVHTSYACHCVTLSYNRISGDWAGYAAAMIERHFPAATALISIGAGSDSNPLTGVTGDNESAAEAQGVELAAEVQRLVQGDLTPVSGPIRTTLRSIALPLNDLPTRADLERLVKKGGPRGYNAATQLKRLDDGKPLLTEVTYPIQTVTFGDSLCQVFLAGEVCVDYSLRLKKEFDQERLWVMAYSNDFCSYIPSERLVHEGGYGGGAEVPYFALPTTLKAGLEKTIMDEIHQQVPPLFRAPAGTQGVAPKSPQASLRHLRTNAGLTVRLAAAEPHVADPVAIDFGADGRLWVVEMTDYGRGLDDQFEPAGRIRWLRDTDQDGTYDESHIFADGLTFPTDVKVWRDGVLICDAPDVLLVRDTNQDGRGDVTTTLLTGFATHNAQARVNSLRWGLDNWVYGACGLFGGQITSTLTGKTVNLPSRDFRFRPDTGELEPVAGRTQQGRCRNDWGDWFGCTNSTLGLHFPVVDRYLRRNPWLVAPPRAVAIAAGPAASLFPPGSLVRFKLSGAPGRATSACGLTIYRDQQLGTDYYGNAFVCEPVHQSVHRMVLDPAGATFAARRSELERTREFLSSTDRWFRPVQARTGLDGGLWVVDMYRYVIEHSRWIPAETLDELDVMAGQGRGRIYRVLRTGSDHTTPRLEGLSNRNLAEHLAQTNGIVRDTVHQLLLWRKATDVESTLRDFLVSGPPHAQVHALGVLDGLELLSWQDIATALRSEHAGVLRQAVRLAERWPNRREFVMALAALAETDDLKLRAQVAASLGELNGGGRTLGALAAGQSDPWVRAAILSSINDGNARDVLAACDTTDKAGESMLPALLPVCVRAGDAEAVDFAFRTWDRVCADPAERLQVLAALLQAADLGRAGPLSDSGVIDDVAKTYHTGQTVLAAETAQESLRLAALALCVRPRGRFTKATLPNTDSATADILDGMMLTRVAARLITAQEPPSVQVATVKALARAEPAAAPELLLSRWASASQAARYAIVDALLSRPEWNLTLLQAVAEKTISPSWLDASRRQRLLQASDARVREKAAVVLQTAVSESRAAVLARYRPALAIQGRVVAGRGVFRRACAACHRLEDHGHHVGPDLLALTNQSDDGLLTAVFDPNRDVDARYVEWTAARSDGRVASGALVEETAGHIRLREGDGKEHVVPRSELVALKSADRSLMPEGVEKDLSLQDFADLTAYIAKVRSP